eukprot:5864710-Pleurochrysis_carterae.AAC.2
MESGIGAGLANSETGAQCSAGGQTVASALALHRDLVATCAGKAGVSWNEALEQFLPRLIANS